MSKVPQENQQPEGPGKSSLDSPLKTKGKTLTSSCKDIQNKKKMKKRQELAKASQESSKRSSMACKGAKHSRFLSDRMLSGVKENHNASNIIINRKR